MSLSVDGVWKVGVWATTVWADGVWREGEWVPPVVVDEPAIAGIGSKTYGLRIPAKVRRKQAKAHHKAQRKADSLIREAKEVIQKIEAKSDEAFDVAELSRRIQAAIDTANAADQQAELHLKHQEMSRQIELQQANERLAAYLIDVENQRLKAEELDIVYVTFALLS